MNGTTQSVETALQLFEPTTDLAYSIESVAHITQVPRHLIAVYCREGFITPIGQPELEGWWFDGEAIRALRRIELLRAEYGMNLRSHEGKRPARANATEIAMEQGSSCWLVLG